MTVKQRLAFLKQLQAHLAMQHLMNGTHVRQQNDERITSRIWLSIKNVGTSNTKMRRRPRLVPAPNRLGDTRKTVKKGLHISILECQEEKLSIIRTWSQWRIYETNMMGQHRPTSQDLQTNRSNLSASEAATKQTSTMQYVTQTRSLRTCSSISKGRIRTRIRPRNQPLTGKALKLD